MEGDGAAEWDMHRPGKEIAVPEEADGGWQKVSNTKTKSKANAGPSTKTGGTTSRSPEKSVRNRSKRGRQPGAWRDAHGRTPAPPQRARAPPKLIEDDDDEAQADWRSLKPATLFVRVPTQLAASDGGQELMQRIARGHSTFLARPSEHQTASTDSQVFGIWGPSGDAEKARAAIAKWAEEMMGPRKATQAGKFAKLASMTPVLRQRTENKWRNEVKVQRFRQHPPPNMTFGMIGTFHWPVQDYPPAEILGPNYEALDPIRMECSCYVVWKGTTFQVMGKNMERVKDALLRLKQTVFQIAAKQLPTTRMCLLHWLGDARPLSVLAEEYEYPGVLRGPSSTETRQCLTVRSGEDLSDEHNGSKRASNESKIYAAVMQMLGRLPYYRGSIKLRMHLGRFLATQYRLPQDGVYDFEDFQTMTKESQFQGLITRELGDRAMEGAALAIFQKADDLLCPLDADDESLSDVKPGYTVYFTFTDKQGNLLRLQKSWQSAQERSANAAIDFNETARRWTRPDRELIDICVADLSTSYGWAFTANAAHAIDPQRLDPALDDFARTIAVDTKAALRHATDQPFVKFKPWLPNAVLKSIEQRITYAHALKDFDYNVELTRFQRFVYPDRAVGSLIPPSASQTQIFEPRWGLCAFGTRWDSFFADNEKLSVGSKAAWTADSEEWFPLSFSDDVENEAKDAGRGFSNVVARLRELEGRLRKGVHVDDLLGGMSIG